MKQLLKFEFHKVFKNKTIYIFAIISFLSFLLSLIIIKENISNYSDIDALQLLPSFNSVSNITTIFVIYSVIYVINDFDLDTIKNIYAHGFSKNKVYFSKYITCLLSTSVVFCFLLGVYFLLTRALFNKLGTYDHQLLIILGHYIFFITKITFAFCVSMIFKKMSLSLMSGLIIPFGVTLILQIIDLNLKWDNFKFAHYWFDNIPDFFTINTIVKGEMYIYIIILFAYIIIFNALAIFIHNKKSI